VAVQVVEKPFVWGGIYPHKNGWTHTWGKIVDISSLSWVSHGVKK
jgi:hypothetical protein